MFKIALLHTNGSRKGKRHVVDGFPFVIGRHESCSLHFDTRTISRKHCAVVLEEERVYVQDLKSRNGTAVDGEKVAPGERLELSHHCIVQIGKYTFRVSIRDMETNRPYRPALVDLSTLSGQKIPENFKKGNANQLMDELEDLASRLGSSEEDEHRVFESTMNLSATPKSDESSGLPEESEPDSAGGKDESTVMLDPKTAIEDDSRSDDDDEHEDSQGPSKIPGHLKPKGPKDSQDAAAAALKNLFVK